MEKIRLTEEQARKASTLGEGKVVHAYRDENTIRMETEDGEDPYVWRDGDWRRMRLQ